MTTLLRGQNMVMLLIREKKISFDYFIVGGFLLIFWLLSPLLVGSPGASWDELLYMDIAINPKAEPFIMNRYFHIYLQRLFFQLAGHPLLGVKIFWAFLVGLTSFLVYMNAKCLTQRSNSLNGFLALLFFLSQPLVFKDVGVTYVDLTVMMTITLGVTLYLLYQHGPHYRAWLLVGLGLVFFMAMKSKETSICLAVLFLGLGFAENKFSSSLFFKNIRLIIAGIIVGIGIFMALNHFILGELLFGWRPSDFTTLFSFNLRAVHARPEGNWYDYLLTTSLLSPFLIYLANFARYTHQDDSLSSIKMIWLLPLVIISFLSVSMIKGAWGVTPRYFIYSVPLITILAGQFFHIQNKITVMGAILGAVALYGLSNLFLLPYALSLGWKEEGFLNAIMVPIALSVALGLIMVVRRWEPVTTTLIFTCLFVLTFHNLQANIMRPFDYSRSSEVERSFYPFSYYSKSITYTPFDRFFISAHIQNDYKMLCKKTSERCKWMFNVFFNQKARSDQFVYSDNLSDALTGDFTYIFLTKKDWDNLQYAPEYAMYNREIRAAVQNGTYRVEVDSQQQIVLIHKKGL